MTTSQLYLHLLASVIKQINKFTRLERLSKSTQFENKKNEVVESIHWGSQIGAALVVKEEEPTEALVEFLTRLYDYNETESHIVDIPCLYQD